jgi:glycosyltransferase involved in cell wall biosynthesis
MIKLSVIIPVYNSEQYLGKAVDSVLDSSIAEDIEIIIVDDFSYGNCKEIADYYSIKTKNLKYIRHRSNKGLFAARMTGIKQATGQYIAHLDADDLIVNDIYAKACHFAKKNSLDVVMFDFINFNEKDEFWIERNEKIFPFENKSGNDLFKEVFFANTVNWPLHVCWNKLIKKDILLDLLEILPTDDRHFNLYEDLVWSSALFLYLGDMRSISFLSEVGLNYFNNKKSITRSSSFVSFVKNINDIELCYSMLFALFKRFSLDPHILILLTRFKITALKYQVCRVPFYFLVLASSVFLRFIYYMFLYRGIDSSVDDWHIDNIVGKINSSHVKGGVYVYGNNKFVTKLVSALKLNDVRVTSCIVTSKHKSLGMHDCLEVSELGGMSLDAVIIASIGSYYEILDIIKRNNISVRNIIGVF